MRIESKWEQITIDNILAQIESGSRPKGGVKNNLKGVLSLGGEHIHNFNGYIDISSPKFVSEDFFNQTSTGVIKPNDILLCKDGALTGKVAFVGNDLVGQNAMVNEHVFILRCDDLVTQKYLFIALHSPQGQQLLKAKITGTAQGGLNMPNLKSVKIPLPPKEIQEKIVAEIEVVEKDAQSAINNISTTNNQIEAILSCSIGDIRTLSNVAPFVTESTKLDEISLSNYITTDNMLQNKFGVTTFAGEPNISSITKYKIGDILISNIRPYLKKIWYADTNGGCSKDVLVFRSLDEALYLPKYVYYMLQRDNFFEYIMEGKKGVKMPRGDKNKIMKYSFIVPAIEEQQRIVAQIEALEAEINKAQQIIDNAPKQKAAILKKYL